MRDDQDVPMGGDMPGATPGEPRRPHPAWFHLEQHHWTFTQRLAAIGETWYAAAPMDELEAAVAVTRVLKELDDAVGEWLCAVWWALLTVSDAERSPTAQMGEWALAPEASAMIRRAHEVVQREATQGERRWDGGDPSVRQRLDALRATLHAMATGYQVVDPLADAGREVPFCCWYCGW